mgnify:CR=1 FL=1
MLYLKNKIFKKINALIVSTISGNMFDEKANKPKEEWKTIKANKKYVLDEMTSDIVDEIAKYAY